MLSLQVTEDLAALLLPSLLAGLCREAGPDLRAATLMITVQLCASATLADTLLEGAFCCCPTPSRCPFSLPKSHVKLCSRSCQRVVQCRCC